MICRVFIATSLDGFIARPNGDLDWLPQAPSDVHNPEDYGYQAFMAAVDGVVLGRNSYDLVKTFTPWPYGTRPVVVLSHHQLPPLGDSLPLTVMAATPDEVIDFMANQGCRNLYIDGGQTIHQFLAAGLVQELILTRIPILLGQGIPLFGPLTQDIHWQHLHTFTYSNGLVQSHYRVG